MHRVVPVATSVALAVSLFGAADPAPSRAAVNGATAVDIAYAMTPDNSVVTGASFVALPDAGAVGVSDGAIGAFPTNGTGFGVLSTGLATTVDDANDAGDTGVAFGGVSVRGDTDFDVTILKIDLNIPTGVNCLLGMHFQFFSEEYPEWVNTEYNDAFIAELDASTWTTNGSTISAPGNFAFDPSGDVISINSSGNTSMSPANSAGTTFDAATPVLTAATPITPGAHSLYLSIFDQGDDIYDSAVFLDALELGTVANTATDCVPGATPIEGDTDSDGDGAPDTWEEFFGSDPNNANDNLTGYTHPAGKPDVGYSGITCGRSAFTWHNSVGDERGGGAGSNGCVILLSNAAANAVIDAVVAGDVESMSNAAIEIARLTVGDDLPTPTELFLRIEAKFAQYGVQHAVLRSLGIAKFNAVFAVGEAVGLAAVPIFANIVVNEIRNQNACIQLTLLEDGSTTRVGWNLVFSEGRTTDSNDHQAGVHQQVVKKFQPDDYVQRNTNLSCGADGFVYSKAYVGKPFSSKAPTTTEVN